MRYLLSDESFGCTKVVEGPEPGILFEFELFEFALFEFALFEFVLFEFVLFEFVLEVLAVAPRSNLSPILNQSTLILIK